jgi:uncharacterized integral membrane protein
MSHDEGWKEIKDERALSPFLIGLVVVGVLTLIFVLLNSSKTEINFVFFTVNTRIWVVILVALALGMALDRLLQLWLRRRKAKTAKAGSAKG